MKYKYRILIKDASAYARVYEGWFTRATDAVLGAMRADEPRAHRGVGTHVRIDCHCLDGKPRRRKTSGIAFVYEGLAAG